jgi:hypothetical protein
VSASEGDFSGRWGSTTSMRGYCSYHDATGDLVEYLHGRDGGDEDDGEWKRFVARTPREVGFRARSGGGS